MADENTGTPEGLSFKNAADLTTFLTDLQGKMANMQETIDKLAPVDETPPAGDETPPAGDETPPTEDEVSEIDKLLQES